MKGNISRGLLVHSLVILTLLQFHSVSVVLVMYGAWHLMLHIVSTLWLIFRGAMS